MFGGPGAYGLGFPMGPGLIPLPKVGGAMLNRPFPKYGRPLAPTCGLPAKNAGRCGTPTVAMLGLYRFEPCQGLIGAFTGGRIAPGGGGVAPGT